MPASVAFGDEFYTDSFDKAKTSFLHQPLLVGLPDGLSVVASLEVSSDFRDQGPDLAI